MNDALSAPFSLDSNVRMEQFRRTYIGLDFSTTKRYFQMIRKRARVKDLKVEFAALFEYKIWVKFSLEMSENLGSERRTFFAQLLKDITEDEEEAYEELDELWSQASVLDQFEYLYLDEDGGTE